jgi:hypothetical protein
MHLLKNPQNIVQHGCFAECLDNGGVDDLWDGALLVHQIEQLYGLLHQSVIAEPIEHGQSRLFHLPQISCISSDCCCPGLCSGSAVFMALELGIGEGWRERQVEQQIGEPLVELLVGFAMVSRRPVEER